MHTSQKDRFYTRDRTGRSRSRLSLHLHGLLNLSSTADDLIGLIRFENITPLVFPPPRALFRVSVFSACLGREIATIQHIHSATKLNAVCAVMFGKLYNACATVVVVVVVGRSVAKINKIFSTSQKLLTVKRTWLRQDGTVSVYIS